MTDRSSTTGLMHFLKRAKYFFVRKTARLPGNCQCVVCGKFSRRYLPYQSLQPGFRAPEVIRQLSVVGSDLERFACPQCGCSDRERHLKLYLDQSGVLERIAGARVLHFAPEANLSRLIAEYNPTEYIRADLYPAHAGIVKTDMLKMQFATESFDIVIANHVLEHVNDDMQALREIARVLRPEGLAILQTPFSSMLHTTFEDHGITSPPAREHAYGQDDHVRLYGRDIVERFTAAGLTSRVRRHGDLLVNADPAVFGVNPQEPFFLFERPAPG